MLSFDLRVLHLHVFSVVKLIVLDISKHPVVFSTNHRSRIWGIPWPVRTALNLNSTLKQIFAITDVQFFSDAKQGELGSVNYRDKMNKFNKKLVRGLDRNFSRLQKYTRMLVLEARWCVIEADKYRWSSFCFILIALMHGYLIVWCEGFHLIFL